jgi:D-serine deaminase-like pyridoxal phosphate-dependent protein
MLLRPHIKSHKSIDIARLQTAAGATGICCSKLGEAEAMASGGLRDILVTTPVVGSLKIARLVKLARTASVRVVVDDAENLQAIARAAQQANVSIGIVVEVDVGQNRCGITSADDGAMLARRATDASHLEFAGLHGYHGILQPMPDFSQRAAAVAAAMDRLAKVRDAIDASGIEVALLTGGGTGSFPIDLQLKYLTELQPGSYVTMDATYCHAQWEPDGAVAPLGQPLTVLTSVVSQLKPDRAIVDAGWKAISNDAGLPVVKDRPNLRFEFAGDEHGVLISTDGPLGLRPGDQVELIPSHCDTTVNLHDRFVVHESGMAETSWPIEARGRCQ